MVGLIRGKLGGVMGGKKLTDYLASIGQPEFERAVKGEEAIAEDAKQIVPPAEATPVKDVKQPPEFTSRSKITDMFVKDNEFIKSTRERGVQLHWINVGTWKTPIEDVFKKHLDAWKISRENASRGREDAFNKVQKEAEINRTTLLIQDLPLLAHERATQTGPNRNGVLRAMLLEYQRFLREQMDALQKVGQDVNPTLVAAIFQIDSLISHKVYPTPVAPQTPEEQRIYLYLRGQSISTEAIQKLEDMKREKYPDATREEILRMIMEDWNKDITEQ